MSGTGGATIENANYTDPAKRIIGPASLFVRHEAHSQSVFNGWYGEATAENNLTSEQSFGQPENRPAPPPKSFSDAFNNTRGTTA